MNIEDIPRYNCTSVSNSNNSGKNEECEFESNNCQKFIRFLTLVLLFGMVYLFYHGFWIIIALLAYLGRILLGGIFVVPLILVVIPMWNTIIKIAENCFDPIWNAIIKIAKNVLVLVMNSFVTAHAAKIPRKILKMKKVAKMKGNRSHVGRVLCGLLYYFMS